jgi:hypothetical protein
MCGDPTGKVISPPVEPVDCCLLIIGRRDGKKNAVLVFTVVALAAWSAPARAQAVATPTPTIPVGASPTPDLNSEIDELQQRIRTLEEKILPFAIIMGILGILGLASPVVILKLATNRYKKGLQDAFYKADPRNMPIYFPKRNFDLEKERLRKLGFKKLQPYEFFADIGERGIVIYSIPGDNFEDEKVKEKARRSIDEIEAQIVENQDKPFAYVIYIKGQLKEVGNLVAKYDRVVAANMPIAMAGHLYTLARSLME